MRRGVCASLGTANVATRVMQNHIKKRQFYNISQLILVRTDFHERPSTVTWISGLAGHIHIFNTYIIAYSSALSFAHQEGLPTALRHRCQLIAQHNNSSLTSSSPFFVSFPAHQHPLTRYTTSSNVYQTSNIASRSYVSYPRCS